MSWNKEIAPKKRSWRVGIMLCVGIVVTGWLALYHGRSCSQIANSIGSWCIYPCLRLQQPVVAAVEQLEKKRATVHELHARIAQLEQENQLLIDENVQLYAHHHDEVPAKELAEFRQRYAYNDALNTRIISRTITDQEHSCIIDAGSLAGIQQDMVAVHNHCIVGRVSHVYPLYSKIIFITDRSCKIAAYAATTQVRGIHEGVNSLERTTLTHVNHFQQLLEHDMLLSSGEGLIFPQGFGVGRITAIQHRELWLLADVELSSCGYRSLVIF